MDINDPIKIDQKLRLHVKSTEEESKKAENDQIYYTVKSGDTFYSISREFGVSVDKLKELNNKKDNLLKPGERIRVQ
jgi:membrane-bound lytic murein transglycosylase D